MVILKMNILHIEVWSWLLLLDHETMSNLGLIVKLITRYPHINYRCEVARLEMPTFVLNYDNSRYLNFKCTMLITDLP